jgi:hypothetical protein
MNFLSPGLGHVFQKVALEICLIALPGDTLKMLANGPNQAGMVVRENRCMSGSKRYWGIYPLLRSGPEEKAIHPLGRSSGKNPNWFITCMARITFPSIPPSCLP